MKLEANKVECLNSTEVDNRLNPGKVYVVEKDFNSGFVIIDEECNHSIFSKDRFNVLKWKINQI